MLKITVCLIFANSARGAGAMNCVRVCRQLKFKKLLINLEELQNKLMTINWHSLELPWGFGNFSHFSWGMGIVRMTFVRDLGAVCLHPQSDNCLRRRKWFTRGQKTQNYWIHCSSKPLAWAFGLLHFFCL